MNAEASKFRSALSQQSVASHVSMIMVNLPFPPLPVVVSRGADNVEDTASSHDLLSSAIGCALVQPFSRDDATQTSASETKMKILQDMHVDVVKANDAWASCTAAPCDPVGASLAVQSAYVAYCTHFRSFMRQYPGSPDLRIRNMCDVGPDSPLIQQGREHLRAQMATVDGLNIVVPDPKPTSYTELVRLYMHSMAACAGDNT